MPKQRALSEESLDRMVDLADQAREFMLNGVQWKGDPERLDGYTIPVAYEKLKNDRKEMTKIIGELSAAVLVLASRVESREVNNQ